MPIDKYLYLRKAAEIEEISNRIQLISDINAAFAGSKKKLDDLQSDYSKLMGFEIEWKPDTNWEEKLKKYQR